MIGAREETLGRTRSETKELSSPTNESMERADLTMEDWIQETCLISAVTSGPTEHKTFQEAWHSPVEEERNNWQMAIRKEIKSMIDRGVWRKIDRKNIQNNRRLITEVWILQGMYPLKDEWVIGCSLKTRLADQTKTQQLKWLWSKDTKDSTINQRLVEQTQEVNFWLEGSGGSTLDDTLRKQYLSSSDE